MFNNAQYISDPTGTNVAIRVDINGITSFVPIDANNTDYGTIQDLIASGELTIADAVPPESPST